MVPADIAELQLKLKESNIQLSLIQSRYDSLREQVDDQTHLHLHYEEGIRGHDAVRTLVLSEDISTANPSRAANQGT